MKVKIYDLDYKESGSLELDEEVFGLEYRPDLIKKVVDWQLAKARAGLHNTKTISEVSGTTKKPHRQKGTGSARQGSLRQVHMRGGAVSHGPKPRDYSYSIPKKLRKLALCHAMSAKYEEQKLLIINDISLETSKTKSLMSKLSNFNAKSFLFVDSDRINDNFAKAASNIYKVDALPQIGANVYDILNHDLLLLTEGAVKNLTERLKWKILVTI